MYLSLYVLYIYIYIFVLSITLSHFIQDLVFVFVAFFAFPAGSACECPLSAEAAVVWPPLLAISAFCSLSCRMSVSRLTSWVRLANICSLVDFSAEFSDMKSLCGGQTIC